MYARITMANIVPGKLDEAIQIWQQEVLPSLQQQAGFAGVRFMASRTANKLVGVALWHNEADYDASEAMTLGLRAKFATVMAGPPEIGKYEVIVEV
jgi:hypothetical protein